MRYRRQNHDEVGRTLTTTMTTPILALGAAAIKASISYESAFTSVRKTVDATELFSAVKRAQ